MGLLNFKNGSIVNLFLLMIMAFILVIAVGIIFYASTTINTKLLEDSNSTFQKALGNQTNATELIQNTFGKVPNAYESLKWITMLLIVGMIISILVGSYMTTVNPVYFIAYLLAWIIAIILSAPMSNTYHKIYLNPALSSTFQGFWAQTWFFTHLPIFIVTIGGISAILMIGNMIKNQGGQFNG